jgi:hypothetical protein
MNKLNRNEDGLIPLIITVFAVVVALIYLVFIRVMHAK